MPEILFLAYEKTIEAKFSGLLLLFFHAGNIYRLSSFLIYKLKKILVVLGLCCSLRA